MGLTKTELFTARQNQFAEFAKILGHPARIAILDYLLKEKKCINGSLVQELGLAQATISQHLKELKQVGLIQGTIEGTSMCYCINSTKWQEVSALFELFFGQHQNPGNENCC